MPPAVPDSVLGPKMGLGKRDRLRRERRGLYQAWPSEVRFEVDRLTKLGASPQQVLDRTPFYRLCDLYQYCDYHGFPMKRKGRCIRTPQDKLAQIWSMTNELKLGPTVIARVLGTTRNAICGLQWRYGLRNCPERPKVFRAVYGKYGSARARREMDWQSDFDNGRYQQR